jgi:hypothetical protein
MVGDVKTFMKIVLGALALFMALSITQEWRVFFAGQDHTSFPRDLEKERQVEQTVREFVTLSRHLYQSANNLKFIEKFIERLPASEKVSRELQTDLAYITRNGRTQKWHLAKLEVLAMEQVNPEFYSVLTKEFWIVRTKRLSDGADFGPVLSFIVHARYELAYENLKWQISSWGVVDPPVEEEDQASSTAEVP